MLYFEAFSPEAWTRPRESGGEEMLGFSDWFRFGMYRIVK